MITDDQLATELTRALHGGTDHLAYTGPVPRAHRPVAVAVAPVAATAAVAGLLGWTALTAGGAPTGTAPEGSPTTSAPVARPAPEPAVVTEQIELAGLTFTYTRGVDEPALDGVNLWSFRDQVPAGAEEVDDVDGTRVWVGEDPDTGFASLFIRVGSGQVVVLLSESLTLDQVRELAGTLQLV